MNTTLIFIWYIICGALIIGFKLFYALVNKRDFRTGQNDQTTEIGFECKRTGSERKASPKLKNRTSKRAAGIGLKIK